MPAADLDLGGLEKAVSKAVERVTELAARNAELEAKLEAGSKKLKAAEKKLSSTEKKLEKALSQDDSDASVEAAKTEEVRQRLAKLEADLEALAEG